MRIGPARARQLALLGEQATWPRLEMIKMQTTISRALADIQQQQQQENKNNKKEKKR